MSLSHILSAVVVTIAMVAQRATAHPTNTTPSIAAADPADPAAAAIANANTNASNLYAAWARFCDDDACTVNCGTWVDLSNPGCLANEPGRGSIRVKSNGPDPMVGIVFSPGDACDCQAHCYDASGVNPDCWVLGLAPAAAARSYRFIGWGRYDGAGGQCQGAANNCPSAHALLLDAAEAAAAAAAAAAAPAAEDAAKPAADPAVEPAAVPAAAIVEQAPGIQSTTDLQHVNTAAKDQASPDGGNPLVSWGRFCGSDGCEDKHCGEWLDLSNPGCLTEHNAVYVQLKGGSWGTDVALQYSSDGQCADSVSCQAFVSNGNGCFALNSSYAPATSHYHFKNFRSNNPCHCPPVGLCDGMADLVV